MKEPTLEEIAELITFDRDEDGKLIVSTVVKAVRVGKAEWVVEAVRVDEATSVVKATYVSEAKMVNKAKWVGEAEQVVEIITQDTNNA